MSDDLVELLLESELNMDHGAWATCREAAVEILRLRAENEKLRAAKVELLRLFDEAMDGYADCIPYKGYFLIEKHGDKENFADLRAAAAALKGTRDE